MNKTNLNFVIFSLYLSCTCYFSCAPNQQSSKKGINSAIKPSISPPFLAEVPPETIPSILPPPTATSEKKVSQTPEPEEPPQAQPTPTPSRQPPSFFGGSSSGGNSYSTLIIPFVDCIEIQSNGQFIAHFSYQNQANQTVFIPVGARNYVSYPNSTESPPKSLDLGQPTQFLPGQSSTFPRASFQAVLPEEGAIIWNIDRRQVKATKQSPACQIKEIESPPSTWQVSLGLNVPTPQTVPANLGNIFYFVGSNGFITTVDKETGEVLSSNSLDSGFDFRPLLDANGNLFVGGQNGKFYALDETGQLRWTYTPEQTESFSRSGAALGDDGTLFVGGNSSFFYAIRSDGSLKWSFQGRAPLYGSPVYADQKVFFTALDQTVYALDAETGDWLWEYQTAQPIYRTSLAAFNNLLVFGSEDKQVQALDWDGNIRWTYVLPDTLGGSPVMDEAGSTLFTTQSGHVYKINYQGDVYWSTEINAAISSTPLIGADSTVYVASASGYIYALEGSSGNTLWRYNAGASVFSDLSMDETGLLIFTDATAKVHAIQTQSNGPSNSWFKAGGNSQNTGRVVQ